MLSQVKSAEDIDVKSKNEFKGDFRRQKFLDKGLLVFALKVSEIACK